MNAWEVTRIHISNNSIFTALAGLLVFSLQAAGDVTWDQIRQRSGVQGALSGRILVFDEGNFCGYGRQPQYYRWTTPIEYHLLSAGKNPGDAGPGQSQTAGQKKGNQQRGFKVVHNWTKNLPLSVRAMAIADRTLFIAGQADIIDENEIRRRIGTDEVDRQLREQVEALIGKKGAMLWVVSAADGQKQAELQIEELPAFDGVAAAYGRLYLTTVNGNVLCLGGEK